MKKTNKKSLEEIIRVDHAGERGAIKIYEGQLLALKTFRYDETLKRQIEEMKEHEKEHYEFFENEIKKKKYIENKVSASLGYFGSYTWFWYCNAWEKSYHALHRISRRSNRRPL